MGASSKNNASAQKNSGPQSSASPGKSELPCQASDKKPLKAQTVTPMIVVSDASRQFHGLAAPERDEVGKITLKADKSGDKLGYKEAGCFSADNTNCSFCSDAKCKKKIDPANAPVKYKFSSLKKGVTVYYKGATPGASQLQLTLNPPKDARITVSAAANGAIAAQQVFNVVAPKLDVGKIELHLPFPEAAKLVEEIHLFQPEKKKDGDPPVLALTLGMTASISKAVYDKDGTLNLNGVKATLWKDEKCTVAIGRTERHVDRLEQRSEGRTQSVPAWRGRRSGQAIADAGRHHEGSRQCHDGAG